MLTCVPHNKGSAYDYTSGAPDMKHVEDLSQRRQSKALSDSSSRRGSRSKKSPEVTEKKEIVADEEQPAPEQPVEDDPVANVEVSAENGN